MTGFPDLPKWTAALGEVARTCRGGLQVPANPAAISAWNVASPVQPADFAQQLGALQRALAPSRKPEPSGKPAVVEPCRVR